MLPLVLLAGALALGLHVSRPATLAAWRRRDHDRRAEVLRRTPDLATRDDLVDVLSLELGPASVQHLVHHSRTHDIDPGVLWQSVDAHGVGPATWRVLRAPEDLRTAVWRLSR